MQPMSFSKLAPAGAVLLLLTGSPVTPVLSAQATRAPMAVAGQQSYADVVDRVAPAVVTIRSARRVRPAQQYPFMSDPRFREFFGNRSRGGPGGDERGYLQRGLGSGVVVNADGHILTNHHVVDGAQEITVELNDRRTFPAKLIGSDPPSDLAVLKIEANSLPTLPLGDSDRVRVGDVVLAVGNPLGVGQTVTAGIVSAKGRYTGLSDGSFEDFLQTDAAINQGNSGGALVNTRGELIGINSQILSPSGGNIGIGFAIPSNMAKNVMDQLTNSGKVSRGQMGVSIQPITSDLAQSMDLKNASGVLINSVTPNSPAEKAGLRSGDVITALNGTPVTDPNTLRNRVAAAGPGHDVTLTYLRDGREQTARVRLGELRPEGRAEEDETAPSAQGGGPKLGVSVEPITPELANELNLRRGTQGLVVREVDPNGPAADAGVQPGDLLLEVNRQPVRSTADVRTALSKASGRPALLLVQRGEQRVFLTARPK